MDPDPLEYLGDEEEPTGESSEKEKSKGRLNTLVAITVALLATFLGVCKVKDDNIVQAMQQAQADKIDNYAWFQARNIREEVAGATVAQLTAQAAAAPPQAQATYREQIDRYQVLEREQSEKKREQKEAADRADSTYNELNIHDDQFDLSDVMLALAISLLAMTALTQKRWLYYVALVPTAFGILMGLAGLLGWGLHPDALTRLLS